MPSPPWRIQGHVDHMESPASFALKRAGTHSTKESYTTHDSSTVYSSYYKFPAYQHDDVVSESDPSVLSCDNSSLTSRHSMVTRQRTNNTEFASLVSTPSFEEESLASVPSADEMERASDDEVIETNTKNRSLSLAWGRGTTSTSAVRVVLNGNSVVDEECPLPEKISRSDITVTIDIDDEARSSRVEDLDEEDLDVEIRHRPKTNGGLGSSPRQDCHRKRRIFEEQVRDSIADDLRSVYTAPPKTAKWVLCVVISVLSDGTLDHTFWSGGRVGLTEIVLNWVLFDADDLQVYKRGRVVQKKDFGFGPLGLTENEGQHYLATELAPRAANEIMSKIGHGASQDLLVDF